MAFGGILIVLAAFMFQSCQAILLDIGATLKAIIIGLKGKLNHYSFVYHFSASLCYQAVDRIPDNVCKPFFLPLDYLVALFDIIIILLSFAIIFNDPSALTKQH